MDNIPFVADVSLTRFPALAENMSDLIRSVSIWMGHTSMSVRRERVAWLPNAC